MHAKQVCLYLLLFSLLGVRVVKGDESPRPNILFFYVDDMGWGSIGPNGQADRRARNLPSVRTPNLDRLAAEGVNFTRGYGCHVCSPARSSLQTGFHQGHTFADRNDPNNAKKAIRAEDPSIGVSLSDAGYATGYWGKWGYGGSKSLPNPVIENVQTLPTSHGYQHVLAELHHVRAHTFFQPTLWKAPAAPGSVGGLELTPNSLSAFRNQDVYPSTPALQNHSDYPAVAYCDDAYAFAALDFVRKQGQLYHESGRPFFALLAVQIPHAPFGEITRLPEWDQAYAGDPHFASLSPQAQQWAAMVTRIDAHFGNILAALEDPNHDGDKSDSIASNTLVVFQSDNGGPGGRNNVELDANGGLSGVKGRIQEGGIRVPLIMRWPAAIHSQSKLKAGENCDRVVDVTDLLPTFCELAGAPTPLGIDGVSIAPTLTGRGRQRQRDFVIHEAGNGQSIIHGNYKLVRSRKSPPRLYDLNADPTETTDLAAEHPELVRGLGALLLGERVAEPKGFANTYHHWIGTDNAVTSEAENWSDYRYANAGVTYMVDDGPPRRSWVARIRNTNERLQTARVDRHLNVLALEVQGGAAQQTVLLPKDVELTGRNEIRLSQGANLVLDGGTVSTLRWLDIAKGAKIQGHGKIHAMVANQGAMRVNDGGLEIQGDYEQGATATLRVQLGSEEKPIVRVAGRAMLSGKLTVEPPEIASPRVKGSFTIVTAENIEGRFANGENEIVSIDGTRYAIQYSRTAVTLRAK